MRSIIVLERVSLDGFAARSNGQIDFIRVDDELFDFTGRVVDSCDTALYGRQTYGMMASYWPAAGGRPGASRHDVDHARRYGSTPPRQVRRLYDTDRRALGQERQRDGPSRRPRGRDRRPQAATPAAMSSSPAASASCSRCSNSARSSAPGLP